ncbi:MAG: hypothetical protein H8E86_04530 [Planctomycetes bacterium]|nr:hypothetical protein [Planctomycetota bacterium]
MRFALFVVATTSCALSANALCASGSDYSEAAIRQLQAATKKQRSGQHLLNLASLRSLRDSALRPFFSQFTQHPEWTVQVHAVLGLAELSDEKTVDPWLVQQIAPTAREYLIAQALDDDLIGQEQMEALIKWEPLEPTPKLLLLADLLAMGVEVDDQMVKELTSSTDLSVSLFASLLFQDPDVLKETTQSLRRATRSDRDAALKRTFRLIRQYSYIEAIPWLVSLIDDRSVILTPTQRYWTLFAVLAVDKDIGLEIWNREFSFEPDRKDQVRYFLLLLEAGIYPTPEIRDRLMISLDDPLLGNMFTSGKINGDPAAVTPEMIDSLSELVLQGHRASTDWAFRIARDSLTDDQAKQFYEKLSKISEDANSRRKEAAIRSFTELIRVAPAAAWDILRETKDDSQQQKLLLLAMLQIADEEAVQEASKLPRIGVSRADVLTLLLIARSTTPLQEKDQEYLGIIAAGGGNVSPALETQAAWLYLRRVGLADKALAAVSTR